MKLYNLQNGDSFVLSDDVLKTRPEPGDRVYRLDHNGVLSHLLNSMRCFAEDGSMHHFAKETRVIKVNDDGSCENHV